MVGIKYVPDNATCVSRYVTNGFKVVWTRSSFGLWLNCLELGEVWSPLMPLYLLADDGKSPTMRGR